MTINKTLRILHLDDPVYLNGPAYTKASFGAEAYEAFCTMLRVNTSINLYLPPFDSAGADERDIEHFNQMVIEQRLNQVGRGRLLASRQTTREEYVDALNDLNTYNVDNSPAFQVGCLYSLLRLNPSVVCMSSLTQ